MAQRPASQQTEAPKQSLKQMLDRQPPHDLVAEGGLLGSLVLDPSIIDDALAVAEPAHCYDLLNAAIYKMMAEMREEGMPIDDATLLSRARALPEMQSSSAAAQLVRLCNAVPNAANALWYAGIVRDHALRRGLLESSMNAVRDALDTARPIADVLAESEAASGNLIERNVDARSRMRRIDAIAADGLARIEARRSGAEDGGLLTGFEAIDAKLGGMKRTEYVLVAARTSNGKSSFALDVAQQVARAGESVLYVSLEMSEAELSDKLYAMESNINLTKVRAGLWLSEDEMAKLTLARAAISSAPLWIDDTPGLTMSQVVAMARRCKKKHGLRLLVIDYMQFIIPDDVKMPRQEQVASLNRRLKRLAKELDITVMALAQVNRAAGEIGRAPKLAEIRESGSSEQDADAVLMLHLPYVYAPHLSEGKSHWDAQDAEVHVAKNRNGPIGVCRLSFIQAVARFVNSGGGEPSQSPQNF